MKKFILAVGLMGACTAAFADQAVPSPAQATQALQNAMQREIQAVSNNAQTQGAQPQIDVAAATNVVKSLEVKSLNNCQAPSAGPGVACDVHTSAEVRGTRREDTNKYQFWQQAGRWEARLASNS